MKEIINILMRRDGLTEQEALDLVVETKQMMKDCDYDAIECEEIFMDMIGLEPDYLMNFLLG